MTPLESDLAPGEKWKFDGDVTAEFDDMLSRSIPEYETMRRLTFEVGSSFVQEGTDVVDLGASRGEAVAPFVDAFDCTYTLIEVSDPMRDTLHERFHGRSNVKVLDWDLRNRFPMVEASLVLSVLTVQFVPIEHRQRILRKVYDSLLPGGALVLVEKVLGATADLDAVMVNRYHEMKRRNGYTEDDIRRKRLSLEGVLVPVTARMNEEFLASAGFREIDCFWRHLNFCSWVAIR